jgi:hypothetical protein
VSTRLIDPSGDVWPGATQRIADALQASIYGDQLLDYLVRNLGWVYVRSSLNTLVIRCRPALMSEAALVTLLFQIHDATIETVFAIELVAKGRTSQIIRDRDQVTIMIAALTGPQSSQRFWRGERFIMSTQPSDSSPFGHVQLQVQDLLSQTDDLERIAPVLSGWLGTRWSLSEFDQAKLDWRELVNGGGFTPFNPTYSASRRGARLSDYTDDFDYVRWVNENRRRVCAGRLVEFANVDAIVTFERVGEARLRYNRMSLPVVRNGGQRAVLIAAVTDSSIDLRK